MGSKASKSVQTLAAATGVNNGSATKVVKETIKTAGGKIDRATNQQVKQVKQGVKQVGNAVKNTVSQGSEGSSKVVISKPKEDIKEVTKF